MQDKHSLGGKHQSVGCGDDLDIFGALEGCVLKLDGAARAGGVCGMPTL